MRCLQSGDMHEFWLRQEFGAVCVHTTQSSEQCRVLQQGDKALRAAAAAQRVQQQQRAHSETKMERPIMSSHIMTPYAKTSLAHEILWLLLTSGAV